LPWLLSGHLGTLPSWWPESRTFFFFQIVFFLEECNFIHAQYQSLHMVTYFVGLVVPWKLGLSRKLGTANWTGGYFRSALLLLLQQTNCPQKMSCASFRRLYWTPSWFDRF
jgi:hypothetical protein